MKTNNIAFYNPKHIGCFDIGVSQINKMIPFKTTAGVFLNTSRITFYQNSREVISFEVGNGLTITGSNIFNEEKTLELILNGADFSNYRGHTLQAKCTFFVEGDIEIEFDLQII